jgi:hypothetical protein
MIASMFPLDAKRSAFVVLMPFDKAATNATSEEKGKIVAAKKAEKKRANSVI